MYGLCEYLLFNLTTIGDAATAIEWSDIFGIVNPTILGEAALLLIPPPEDEGNIAETYEFMIWGQTTDPWHALGVHITIAFQPNAATSSGLFPELEAGLATLVNYPP